MDAKNLLEEYGSHTFNDDVMRDRLPNSTYREFHKSIENNEPLGVLLCSFVCL